MWMGGLAQAVPFTLTQTYDDAAPEAFDHFGRSVSVSGDNVVIGAQSVVNLAGQAYLYSASTGALLQTFNNPTPGDDDYFGNSVSVSGDNVVIGARADNTGATQAGQAYLYSANTGALLQTFNNPAPGFFDHFGNSVSVSGDNVVIGAELDNTGTISAGQAYLFRASTGALLQTFNNPTPVVGDFFGNSVSVSGDNVVIGAELDDTGASSAGQAYLFRASTGALLQTFNNPAPEAGDQFGNSVSVSGDNVVIGAAKDNTGASNAGQVYLFSASTGALLQTFNNPAPLANDFFGDSVSVSGDNVVIGAGAELSDLGRAYLFSASTGALLQTFNNPGEGFFGDSTDSFANSVAVSGNNIVIGAEAGDVFFLEEPPLVLTDVGKAYLFSANTGGLTVPEPSPLALLGVGFLGMVVMRRRREARA
jgi:hypothetical protein